jgi:hypothetical protein
MSYLYEPGSHQFISVARRVFIIGDHERSLYIVTFFFFCNGIITLRVSWPPPWFLNIDIFRGGVVSPTPNPQPKTAETTLLAVPGAYAPASMALRVAGARSTLLHCKAVVLE